MVPKHTHEFRDPIHQLIKCDAAERSVIDSRPVQRLRNVHQLATSYLVYPGATHKRFEHSLGVMELAGRVFDVIANPETVHPTVRELVPEISDTDGLPYWRRVVRMAALCHDIGHLPFSHAAEHALLPDGWSHERLTVAVDPQPRDARDLRLPYPADSRRRCGEACRWSEHLDKSHLLGLGGDPLRSHLSATHSA